MARAGGAPFAGFTFVPKFTLKKVRKIAEEFNLEQEERALQVLFKVGEDFVDRARLLQTYDNHTNNLRSSIGYAIYKNGVRINADFRPTGDGNEGSGKLGMTKGLALCDELSLKYLKGTVLIGVAGMEYAAYVERRNFDVITGSAPSEAEVRKEFDKILKKGETTYRE